MFSRHAIFLACAGIALSLLSGCGGSSGGDGSEIDNGNSDNPIIQESREFFGQDGNLWKPRSDETSSGTGNLVVLFSAKFTTRFDSCEVPLNDGTVGQLVCIDNQPWTHVPFSCFSNGGRQTWRANFPCSAAARVEVTCRDAMQQVVFTVPDGSVGAVCSRFG